MWVLDAGYGDLLVFLFMVFFFVKQKTAYEMRISDWSSDVCSSDLSTVTFCDTDDATDTDTCGLTRYFAPSFVAISLDSAAAVMPSARTVPISGSDTLPEASTCNSSKLRSSSWNTVTFSTSSAPIRYRSEEHTSELQSLMRIPYAVFCLNKKHTTN